MIYSSTAGLTPAGRLNTFCRWAIRRSASLLSRNAHNGRSSVSIRMVNPFGPSLSRKVISLWVVTERGSIYSPSGSLGIGGIPPSGSRCIDFSFRLLLTSASRTFFTQADGRIPSISAASLYDFNCFSVTLMCGRRAVAGFTAFGLPLGLSATANPIMPLLYHIYWWYIKCLLNVFLVVQLIGCFKGATNTPEAIATTESNLLMEDSIMSNSNTSTQRKFLNRAQSAAVRIAAEKRSREFNAALPKELSVKTKYAPAQKMPASKAEAIQAILDQVKARRLAV